MSKLKVAGTWGGIIEAELENWTLSMLRDEVAKRSGLDPESIKLIYAGKILNDDTKTLSQLGIKENSKILSTRGAAPEEEKSLMAEEERWRRLARVKAAATALSKRHVDGSLPMEDYNIELEDQGGRQVKLGSETDQSAAMMGLMLHTKGKSLMKNEKYGDALEVLVMAEESFLLCDPKILELVDNVPMMEIDIVWCYFLLRDIECLSDAGVRLERARKGLERAHGKDLSRVRLLQAGQCPELALYVRVELLEGVVAYHTGQNDKALSSLKSAHAKLLQLQIPDETLSLVMSMGFTEKEAKRALRVNNKDIATSVDFLIEERAKRAQKYNEDLQRQKEILEQKTYGVTPMNKGVDMQMLERLASIGYARDLAAESLRRHENDFQEALDALTNPEVNSSIQVYIESRKRKRQEDQLVSLGFERGQATSDFTANGGATSSTSNNEAVLETEEAEMEDDDTEEEDEVATDGEEEEEEERDLEVEKEIQDEVATNGEERDLEVEKEIEGEIAKVDALSAYDINLDKEVEAVNEYLVLLDASQDSG